MLITANNLNTKECTDNNSKQELNCTEKQKQIIKHQFYIKVITVDSVNNYLSMTVQAPTKNTLNVIKGLK